MQVKRAGIGPLDVELHFLVADSGPGIPVDKQRSIFDDFVQADGSMTRNYGGTGLGLAIAAKLAALMGGRIWVDSELGKGSRFHFSAHFRHARSRAGREQACAAGSHQWRASVSRR